MDIDGLITVQDAMERTGRRYTTIVNATNKEKDPLPCTRVLGRVLFRPEDVDAWKARTKRGRPKKNEG
jgi:hypothetical protein